MARKSKKCEGCSKEFTPSHSSVRFCGNDCLQAYRRVACPINPAHRMKISVALKQHYDTHETKTKGEKHSLAVAVGTKGKHKFPKTITECSSRTMSKILKRMKLGCSRCGWDEGICDLHHIEGRKIENPNHHSNLTYICPNCHRLFHEKKIGKQDVKTLEEQVGDLWKEFYYG